MPGSVTFSSSITPEDGPGRIVAESLSATGRAQPVEARVPIDRRAAQAPPQPWIKPEPGRGEARCNHGRKFDPWEGRLRCGSTRRPATTQAEIRASLLVTLDGETNGAKTDESLIPVPTIVENLMAAKKYLRTLVVLVGSGDHESRNRNLRGSDPFADYLAKELAPLVRSALPGRGGPSEHGDRRPELRRTRRRPMPSCAARGLRMRAVTVGVILVQPVRRHGTCGDL